MKFTAPEKMILLMLAEIHEKLGIQGGMNTKLLQNAIYSENTWALSWEMSGVVGSDRVQDPPEVHVVVSVLDMWDFLERAYESFSAEEKERVKTEAEPFGNHVKFTGFDGNNEGTYLGIADFLVDDLGRWSRFKGRDLNSHMPTLDIHQRMLEVFEPIRTKVLMRELTVDEVVAVLLAQKYPE